MLTRSGQQPIVVNLDIEGVAEPEEVTWVDPAHPATRSGGQGPELDLESG